MNHAIVDQIEEAWDHLPSTPPKFAEFVPGDVQDVRASVLERAKTMGEDGARWGRLTEVPGGFWVEGWVERPLKETPAPTTGPERAGVHASG